MGPSIFQEDYEVGVELKDVFEKKHPYASSYFSPYHDKEKRLFDLRGFVLHPFLEMPFVSKEIVDMNTFREADLFFSCRRQTKNGETPFGCQLSAIGITS